MKPFHFIHIFFGIFILSSPFTHGQIIENQRLEIPLSEQYVQEFDVLPLDESGLLLANIRTDHYGRNTQVQFTKLDTVFRIQWSKLFTPPILYDLKKTYLQKKQALWQVYRKVDSQEILLLRLDLETHDMVFLETKLLTRMDIEHFSVVQNKVLLSGTYNDRPVVELITIFDKNAKILPDLYANNYRISALEVNEDTGTTFVLLRDERRCTFLLKSYDYEGKLIDSKQIGEDKKVPITGKLIVLPDDRKLIVGNYSERCTSYSVGFYLHDLSENKTNYVDFTHLSNFFSYLPEKKQQRIKQRIDTKKEKGIDVKIRHRILVHDIIQQGNEWVMLAEVYYPEYKTPNGYGVQFVKTYRVGKEYYNNFKYSHAIICGFTADGKLLWNNSVGLGNMESNELSVKVQATKTATEGLLVAYPKNKSIQTLLLNKEHTWENLTSIETNQETTKGRVIDEFQVDLTSWYTNNFITYGIITVRNPENFTVKEYYYLHRLTYTPDKAAIVNP